VVLRLSNLVRIRRSRTGRGTAPGRALSLAAAGLLVLAVASSTSASTVCHLNLVVGGGLPGRATMDVCVSGCDTDVVFNNSDGTGGTLGGLSYGPDALIEVHTYAGDANLDGSVDGLDMSIWAKNFTGSLGISSGEPWLPGDFNGDGSVDGRDAAIWAQSFTGSLGPIVGAVSPIPMPATVWTGLATLSCLGLVHLVRRRLYKAQV
jgi:hypothetical protein